MLVKSLEYDVRTKSMREIEMEIDIPNPRISEIRMRLQEIENEYKSLDYKTIKYIEGDLTEDEWQVHLYNKTLLRDEYDALEEELGGING